MKIKTEKNFLNKNYFDELLSKILESNFFYRDSVSYDDIKDGYYFTHNIFSDYETKSPLFDDIIPILDKLKVKSLYRIKINMYPQTHKIIEHGQHVDANFKCNVFLLSLNTCNGYTRIGKNTIIPSTENEGIFFKSDILHNSTTCTDKNIRLNMNFNYF